MARRRKRSFDKRSGAHYETGLSVPQRRGRVECKSPDIPSFRRKHLRHSGESRNPVYKQHGMNGLYEIGRGERIRTSDSCVPNAVLYQAELHPDCGDDGFRLGCLKRFFSGRADSRRHALRNPPADEPKRAQSIAGKRPSAQRSCLRPREAFDQRDLLRQADRPQIVALDRCPAGRLAQRHIAFGPAERFDHG